MKYFTNIATLEELKKAYRTLAKKYHPDLNDHDTTTDMKAINSEYEQLFKVLKGTATKKEQQQHQTATAYADVMTEVVKMNINIDIIGSWVWCYADYSTMKQYKDSLKALGFKYSSSNKKWYWTEQPMKKRKKATSYKYKVDKYGKDSVKTKKEPIKID